MSADAEKRDRILARVRALLQMTEANGCSEAEALVAAGKAAKLMEEHDLAISDFASLKDERIAQESKPFSSSDRPRELHAAAVWVSMAIGEFFDCKTWRQGVHMIFFGLRDDVELAHMMLAMIRSAMDRELGTYMQTSSSEHPRTRSASFSRGMGSRIAQRIRQLKLERTASYRSRGTELVSLKGQIVDAAMAEKFRERSLKTAKPRKPARSVEAFRAGVQAAERVALGVHSEIVSGQRQDPPTPPIPQPSPTDEDDVKILARLRAAHPDFENYSKTIAAELMKIDLNLPTEQALLLAYERAKASQSITMAPVTTTVPAPPVASLSAGWMAVLTNWLFTKAK